MNTALLAFLAVIGIVVALIVVALVVGFINGARK